MTLLSRWRVRLALAVLLVSATMLVLAAGVVVVVQLAWSALTALLHSLLHFALLLVAMLAATLATLTLLASLHSPAV